MWGNCFFTTLCSIFTRQGRELREKGQVYCLITIGYGPEEIAITRIKITWRSAGYLLLICMMQQGYADDFSFSSTIENTVNNDDTSFLINCNRAEAPLSRCSTGGSAAAYTDPTAFLQEIVIINNIRYYHMIIGGPADGFEQESYIDARNCCYQQYERRPKSASDGYGTGNPGAVVFRMIMSDADFEQEVIKDNLSTKPLISQVSNDGQASSTFQLDMSGIDYETSDVTGTIVNDFQLLGDVFSDTGDFDESKVSDEHLTAGQYVWLPGTGTGKANGTYVYSQDVYLKHDALEDLFKDPAQNP